MNFKLNENYTDLELDQLALELQNMINAHLDADQHGSGSIFGENQDSPNIDDKTIYHTVYDGPNINNTMSIKKNRGSTQNDYSEIE